MEISIPAWGMHSALGALERTCCLADRRAIAVSSGETLIAAWLTATAQ
jgi:hypothetical protein